MTLYLIGTGLFDHKDITLRGLEAMRTCSKVYLEHYTSVLHGDIAQLEAGYGVKLIPASRTLVEQEAEKKLLLPAKEENIALLIVGDVFGATTHTDLMLRAKELGVNVQVIFNASVLTAVGITGLELYKFGKTTSIVFPDDGWLPQTPYKVIEQNRKVGLHTLCLLDIKVAEKSKEDLRKESTDTGDATTQPPRFMTVAQALDVLLRLETTNHQQVITKDTKIVAVARLGQPDYRIVYATVEELLTVDMGAPLHSIIIPGDLHFVEEESLQQFRL